MEKVRLGKSDILVTPITFAAWAIGGFGAAVLSLSTQETEIITNKLIQLKLDL